MGQHSRKWVLLTHAHIDHSGLLPRLSALGYRGPVHTTRATADLLSVMLPDSAYIQEKEAEWAIRHRHREFRGARHEQAPLYTVAQAQACLRQLHEHDYGEAFAPHPELRCVFRNAGHILGAAIVELQAGPKRRLVFCGDLGQPGVASDNAYHVVIGADDAVLDGLSIVQGHADGPLKDSKGGALLCYHGASVIRERDKA